MATGMAAGIRTAAVAGMFYPARKEKLKSMLEGFLKNVPNAPEQQPEGELKALIVPHAGYEYSGQVAAYGYSLMMRHVTMQHAKPKKVILLGPSHYAYFFGVAADANNHWQTPLGTVKVAKGSFGFPEMVEAHAQEHCLEVQIPFLQKTLKGGFEILPLVMGEADPKEIAEQIKDLASDTSEPGTLMVVSSDLSHYHSYETAARLDKETCNAIEKLDYDGTEKGEACGKLSILAAVWLAKLLKWKCRLLKYANSGDVTGDKTRVVGYASFALYKSNKGQ